MRTGSMTRKNNDFPKVAMYIAVEPMERKKTVKPANAMIWTGFCAWANSVPKAATETNDMKIAYLRSSHSDTYPPTI
jgi:hypothetical protein